MTPTAVTPSPVTLEKVYKYFDADTLETKSEKVAVTFNPANDLQDAMGRIGNDQGVVLKALNSYLKRASLQAAKRNVMSKGVSRTVVLSVLRPLRALPPWSLIEDKAKQTDELLKILRSNPAMLEAIRAGAAQVNDDDDEDESDE